jgi:hypothetical protein
MKSVPSRYLVLLLKSFSYHLPRSAGGIPYIETLVNGDYPGEGQVAARALQVVDVEPAVHKGVFGNVRNENIGEVASVVPGFHDDLVVEQREGDRVLEPRAELRLLRAFDHSCFEKDVADAG